MAQYTVTASSGTNWMTTRRQDDWGNWSKATWKPSLVFTGAIPKGAKNISAVLTITVKQPPLYGSYFYADGQKLTTATGVKTINIAVSAGTSSRAVEVTFTGSGKIGSTAQMQLEMSLSITYDYSASPFQRVENGQLVKYRLYKAENGKLVPYSLFKAESGKLVKY